MTACDKFGTKAAELKWNPEKYLMTFSETDDDVSHRNEEHYLEKAVYGVYSKSVYMPYFL